MKMDRIMLTYLMAHLFLLCDAEGSSQNVSGAGAAVLRLGVFISTNASNLFEFAGFIPSLHIGLETVQNSSKAVIGADGTKYAIECDLVNSMCESSATLRGFINQLIDPVHPRIMLLGSDCSVSTEPLASISHNWNLVQISGSSSSPDLSNTKDFPRFLRTVSSDVEVATGVSSLMRQFGWSRVSLLTQNENIFTSFSTEFKTHISDLNFQLIGEHSFSSDTSPTSAFQALQRSPARVIFLNMYERYASEILCLAYRNGMTYPDYVWMVHYWYNEGWWKQGSYGCRVEEMEMMLNMQIVIDHFPRINNDDKDELNIGNITWNQYEKMYSERFTELRTEYPNASYNLEDGAFIFDTVWTAALALNRTAAKGYSLLDFSYTDENISRAIYNEALNVTFFGLTGLVSFDNNTGDRPGRIRLLQFRLQGNLTSVQFGFVTNDSFKYTENQNVDTVFPGGIPQDEEHVHISLPLFAAYTILAVLGIAFAGVCLWFNLWFRNQKIVKLSSPYVNVMIIVGAVIFYVTVILFGVDENTASFSVVDGLCHARIWFCVIGFTLLFGTIFAKAWRIYYIFSHLIPNKKVDVKDAYLFGIVAVLLVLDIVFMLPTTIISSAMLRLEEEEQGGENDGDLPEIIGVCTSDDALKWLIVLLVYKGCLLIGGVFLAFETRKVKIVSLNESRFIGMSVYGAFIVSIALTPIGFLLENFPSTQYAIMGIMMLASVTIILALIFVTKMYKVYRDPEGDSVQIGPNSGSEQHQPKVTFHCSEETYKTQIQKLNEENAVLRRRLTEKITDGTRVDIDASVVSSQV